MHCLTVYHDLPGSTEAVSFSFHGSLLIRPFFSLCELSIIAQCIIPHRTAKKQQILMISLFVRAVNPGKAERRATDSASVTEL